MKLHRAVRLPPGEMVTEIAGPMSMRLLDQPDAFNSLIRLHYFLDLDFRSPVSHARECRERVGRKGKCAKTFVGQIVVSLLLVGAREIGFA